jgi:hypothetical protein
VKLEFVGEQPNANPYEVGCELARDVDLSRGTLRPRFDDTTVATGDIKRVVCADAGIVRYSSTSGYGFAWGQDVYWLNGDNSWQKVDQNGNTTNLSAPSAPSISQVGEYGVTVSLNSSEGTWNVNPAPSWPPTWSNISGNITRAFTFTNSKNWQFAAFLWVAMEVPTGADPTFTGAVNGNVVPVTFYRADNTFGWLVWDVRGIDCSAISSVEFSYTLSSSHTLVVRYYLDVEWGVPAGRQVYVVTLERNGIESVLSTPVARYITQPHPHLSTRGVVVAGSVSPAGQAGDKLRLYRAIDGVYHKVDEYTTAGTYTTFNLYDKNQIGEPYRPSGILPYGPAIVVGNRVAVAVDRVVYLSQPGNPVRFGTVAINEDNQDAFSVVLPESVVALAAGEGAVIAHTKSNQYAIKLVPTFDNELLHCIPPMKVEAPTARSHRAVCGSLLVDAEGNVWAGSTLLFSGVSGTVHCLQVDGRLYIATGNTVYVSKPSWKGWVEYTLPSSVQWMDTDGSSVYVATSTGLYKLEGSTSRKASCTWRTGKLFGDRLSAVRYVHIAGTSATLKLIRPGKADVVMSNVTGRVHVPAGEQTHEWQLEFNVSTEVYQIHLTSEGGIR